MACWSGAWGSLGEDTGLDGFRDTGESCLHCVCTIPFRTLFVGNQYILASIIRHLIRAVLLSATLAIVALPSLARAQSGSAGGSIGNDEKSLSGSRETPRAAEPSKPARRSKTETEAPSRAPRKSSGGNGGANIDGAWIYERRHALRQLHRYGGYLQRQDGGAIRHLSSQSERRRLWYRIRGKPELDHVRPLFRPQRIRHVPTIRWLCRKLDRRKAVVAVPRRQSESTQHRRGSPRLQANMNGAKCGS